MPAIIDRKAVALTSAEKVSKKADAAFASLLKAFDKADLTSAMNRLTLHYNVLTQEGAGEGKRFGGAANHEFATLATAFVDTVTRGNIVKTA